MSIKKKFCLLAFITTTLLCGDDSLDGLLLQYKDANELSKITKSEIAGFLDIYTRDDLDKMQARTLGDVLKLVNIPSVTRNYAGVSYATKPTISFMPNTAIRIFIDDHYIFSNVAGENSLFMINMPIGHIDHIEIYRSSSSVEFSNEAGSVMIKLYTKKPQREEGETFQASVDNLGSLSGGILSAKSIDDKSSYLAYVSADSVQRTEYENNGYTLNSDNENIYTYMSYQTNTAYNKLRIDGSFYQTTQSPFLGLGQNATPQDTEGMKSKQGFVHLTNIFSNGIKLQLSYDMLSTTQDYTDESGILAGIYGLVTNYQLSCDYDVASVIISKNFHFKNHDIMVGGYYKNKKESTSVDADQNSLSFDITNQLYSVYSESKYYFTPTTVFTASLKGDFDKYNRGLKNRENYIARVGFIKNVDKFQVKSFYTKTYYQVPTIYTYSGGYDAPFKTNKDLENPIVNLYSLGVRYKNEKHTVDFRYAYINQDKKILFDSSGRLVNGSAMHYSQYEVNYVYRYSRGYKLVLNLATGQNSQDIVASSEYMATLQLFHSFGKFDVYNELLYRDGYTLYNIPVGDSYNFTSSIKYNVNRDLNFGLKAENIFDDSYEQAYKQLDFPIAVYDRKVWLTVGYSF